MPGVDSEVAVWVNAAESIELDWGCHYRPAPKSDQTVVVISIPRGPVGMVSY